MVKYIVRLTLGTLKNGCYREVAVVGLVAARGDSTVYHRIYCRKCLTLSNKTSHYIRRCISILFIRTFGADFGTFLSNIQMCLATGYITTHGFVLVLHIGMTEIILFTLSDLD